MIEAIQFSSFGEFLNMGGYALNVWGVYAIFGFFVTWISIYILFPTILTHGG